MTLGYLPQPSTHATERQDVDQANDAMDDLSQAQRYHQDITLGLRSGSCTAVRTHPKNFLKGRKQIPPPNPKSRKNTAGNINSLGADPFHCATPCEKSAN